jgi:hypothetical protein
MREGWKCPVCGRGVSPDHSTCDHGEQPPGLYGPMSVPGYVPRYFTTPVGPTYPPYAVTYGAHSGSAGGHG